MKFRIRNGLDLPITGVPQQSVENTPVIRHVAVVGGDYVGMKPTMEVQVGDVVQRGSLLFTDKKNAGVRFTAPVAGTVLEVNRGERRLFQSVVIEAEGDQQVSFKSTAESSLGALSRDEVCDRLNEAGLWTALRRRPYSKNPAARRDSFVNRRSGDGYQPSRPNPAAIIAGNSKDLRAGLQVLKRLTNGSVYFCVAPGTDAGESPAVGVQQAVFEGPHPAGLPGTHIHFLDPVGLKKAVWYINYQDVIAIGKLFVTGVLDSNRTISLAGPQVTQPRLVNVPMGASLTELTSGQLAEGPNRIISGSVLCGRAGTGPEAYLGRYHLQVSVIKDSVEREFMGWQKPGFDKFSVKPIFASALADGLRFAFNTGTNGSPRALVPVGAYERVMPLDIEPTFLLRSLLINDTEQAQLLGALELDEEDLALCTFVDPGKHEFGPVLRQVLTHIEREG